MYYKNEICFITPSLEKGGAERVISILANFLAHKDYNVRIISFFAKKPKYDLSSEIKIDFLVYNYHSSVLDKIKILFLLKKKLSRIKPELVISFGEVFNPLSIIACRLNRIPIIISDRSNPSLNHSLFRQVLRKITYPRAMGMIAQTDRAKEIFSEKKYNKNIHVLPNPLKRISNEVYHPEKKAIIHVGSLKREKNQEDLIHAFKRIGNNEWQVYLVGEGRRRNDLQNLIEDLELNDQVHLIGQVSDVDNWLKKGSIFVFPSLFEGFPNALNEAMAFPLACIAYDCPTGVRELIENGKNGFIVPLKDINGLQEKMTQLMENQNLRLKLMKNSIKNRELYSIDRIGQQFLKIIFKYNSL